jgi:hypothetical protein
MTERLTPEEIEARIAGLYEKFGNPALLRYEKPEAYHAVLVGLMRCLTPQDFVEAIRINNAANAIWQAMRLDRFKTESLTDRVRKKLELEARRNNISEKRKEAAVQRAAGTAPKLATEPEDVLEGLVEKIDDTLLDNATELDYVRAYEVSIKQQEVFDKAVMRQLAIRDNELAQIERYREGLGREMRAVSDRMIAQESKAIEATESPSKGVDAPPLVPSAEEAHDVVGEDRS